MSSRRAPFPRRQVRRAFQHYLTANKWPVTFIVVMWACILALFTIVTRGYLLGLAHGLLLGALVVLISTSFLLVSGMTFQLSGAWGEENTRDVLKAAKRRRLVYSWVDSLEVANGDVDHLLIAPSGLYALDSKWHSHGMNSAVVDRDVASAQRAAGRANSILRSLGASMRVKPVVVVWGSNQQELLGSPREKDDVVFVAGRDLKKWLRSLDRSVAAIDAGMAKSLHKKLIEFRDRIRVEWS